MPTQPIQAADLPGTPGRRWRTLAGAGMAVYLCAALIYFVLLSLHWPLVGDATLLHYCVFLLRHGVAPYRQLVDVNLPGTYAFEGLVTGLFGYGALPWRLFDLLLLAAIGAAALALLKTAGPPDTQGRRWLAALWVATLFALLHGRDGLADLGQRDLLMTGLLGLAYVFFFRALSARPRIPWVALAACGAAIGVATTVKPTALLLLPALYIVYAHSTPRAGGRAHLWVPFTALTLGAALPLTAMLLYLLANGSLGAFLHIMAALVPLHSSLFRKSMAALLGGIISSVLLPLVLLGLPTLLVSKPWRSPRGAALLVGFCFGALSFVLQGRGYPYHRYPLELFLLLLYGRAFTAAESPRSAHPWRRLAQASALLALVFSLVAVVPNALAAMHRLTPHTDPLGAAMTTALKQRGGAALSGHVQCVDMAGGCVTTLLRMRLVQSTGFLYDCYALAPVRPEFLTEQERYRNAWLAALKRTQPAVLIVTSDECGPMDLRYRKLTRWPALAHLLQQNYTLTDEWVPHQQENWYGHPTVPYGFRLYQRSAAAR